MTKIDKKKWINNLTTLVCYKKKKKISKIVPVTMFFDKILNFEIDYSIIKKQLEICTLKLKKSARFADTLSSRASRATRKFERA